MEYLSVSVRSMNSIPSPPPLLKKPPPVLDFEVVERKGNQVCAVVVEYEFEMTLFHDRVVVSRPFEKSLVGFVVLVVVWLFNTSLNQFGISVVVDDVCLSKTFLSRLGSSVVVVVITGDSVVDDVVCWFKTFWSHDGISSAVVRTGRTVVLWSFKISFIHGSRSAFCVVDSESINGAEWLCAFWASFNVFGCVADQEVQNEFIVVVIGLAVVELNFCLCSLEFGKIISSFDVLVWTFAKTSLCSFGFWWNINLYL